ncbi:hypothetical protein BDN70DRAFT_853287 [Pholiota conissans]|uniref:F-box domain-containing protein n=1 Tax=Pholiota conissans TaxID=109636 RepID=A0A9P5Z959_9AGAR|nr:hypothetical protein BDN70DRAFT_853287 [Pholiota conissans]
MSSSFLWDLDVASVNQTISQHQQAITSLDTQIQRYMSRIRQLEYLKQTHISEIRRCKGMITLAKRLPPEILASIFEECIQDGWTRTPLIVSHVCSTWRKAANIPAVWSHVYVNFDARDPYKRTRFWLDKSKDTPLVVDLEIGNEMSHLNKTLELLTSALPRWKALTVKSTALPPVNQILYACNKPAPQLRVIDITVAQEVIVNVDDPDAPELVAFRSSLMVAPQLKSLRINRNVLPGRNILPSSITNLSLQLPSHQTPTTQSLSTVIRLLEELPSLELFSLEVPKVQGQHFEINIDPDRVVELSCLTSMTLMGKGNLFAILPHLVAPSLSRLFLRSSLDDFPPSEVGIWIQHFFRRSSAPIRLFEIRDVGLDPIVYSSILRLLPSVEELRFHDCDVMDWTLQELNGPHGFCPSLMTLDLRWCGRLSGQAIADLVRSRLPAEINDPRTHPPVAASIAEVTLINCSFVKEENIIDLAKMTVCRLIHRGQGDFCNTLGCCDNERYRRRLRQRNVFHSSTGQAESRRRLIL